VEKNILDKMEENIDKTDINETEKNELKKNFLHLKEQKLNLMITGATGAGKSSTINALFNMEVAKVGVTSDPETMEITNYTLGNLVLWDTPGLGDGKEADARHTKNIINKLLEKDEKGNLLIDLVLIILAGVIIYQISKDNNQRLKDSVLPEKTEKIESKIENTGVTNSETIKTEDGTPEDAAAGRTPKTPEKYEGQDVNKLEKLTGAITYSAKTTDKYRIRVNIDLCR